MGRRPASPRLRRRTVGLGLAALLGGGGAVLAGAPAAQAAALPTYVPAGCAVIDGPDGTGTQVDEAIAANSCVYLGPGLYPMAAKYAMPAGHQVYGAGMGNDPGTATILQSAPGWYSNGMEGVIGARNSTDNVVISHLTLDANGLATYAVDAAGFTADSDLLENAYCNGVGIVALNVVVKNSVISGNGFNCPTAPPGAGIYLHSSTSGGSNGNAVITDNSIIDNGGPGLDDGGMNGGTLTGNTITGNLNWAGVSLIDAQGWTVSGNTVDQPYSNDVQPYHPECSDGHMPSKHGSAAILLCDVSTSTATTGNTITGNTVTGHYGLLVEGAPPYVPSGNSLTDNRVQDPGKRFWTGCADHDKSRARPNSWSGNTCNGSSVSGPTLF